MSADRLTLWWADRYTSGLPARARAARRDELVSDLWEHRAASGETLGTELAVLSRWLRGIPADLSWRRVQRRGVRRVSSRASAGRAAGWSVAGLAYVMLVAVHAYAATPLVGLTLYGGDWAPEAAVLYARLSGLLLALLVLGALTIRRHPRLGAALLCAGALGTPLVFLWGAILYGPAGIAVACAGIAVARRVRRRVAPAAS